MLTQLIFKTLNCELFKHKHRQRKEYNEPPSVHDPIYTKSMLILNNYFKLHAME